MASKHISRCASCVIMVIMVIMMAWVRRQQSRMMTTTMHDAHPQKSMTMKLDMWL